MPNGTSGKKETYVKCPCDDCSLQPLCNYQSMLREASTHLPVDSKVFIACEYFKQDFDPLRALGLKDDVKG